VIVTRFLQAHTKSSPVSTVLLVPGESKPTDPDVCRAIVFRILRYVSPHPWGSPLAEAKRQTFVIDKIVNKLWAEDRESSSFTYGGMVQWTPVEVSRTEKALIGKHRSTSSANSILSWIARRQKPSRHVLDDALRVNISDKIRAALKSEENGIVEILYDCRFLVRVRSNLLSAECQESLAIGASSISVVPSGPWLLPSLVQEDSSVRETIVSAPPPDWDTTEWRDSRGVFEFSFVRELQDFA